MVRINIVRKVVAENMKLEKLDTTIVRFPKNVLKILVPVITKSPVLFCSLPAMPL